MFFIWNLFFFTALFSNTAVAQARLSVLDQAHKAELHRLPEWRSLLHVSNKTPHITDPHFLLSGSDFSLELELDKTILGFYTPESQAFACRFPARYIWLKRHLELPDINLGQCLELAEFIRRAPIDKIAVVYASENISQPSSMMGHLLLKISGVNDKNLNVDHAVSFFTEAKTLNIPKLIYESMIKGKKGFFSLSPYNEKIDLYVRKEQRNLWEFELPLTEAQRELTQLHLFELKNTNLIYYFQSYNCATLVRFILSLSIPSLHEISGDTPLDIIKGVNDANEVAQVTVNPSNRWLLRTLTTQLPSASNKKLKREVEESSALTFTDDATSNYFIREIAQSYNSYRLDKKLISYSDWVETKEKIESNLNSEEHFIVNLNNYKNPIKTPQDSQMYIGAVNKGNSSYLRMGFLPASHSLEDDNRQYFGETGLNLASVSILANLNTGDYELEKFELYRAESIIPYNRFVGGISGRFSIGFEHAYDQKLKDKKRSYVDGALGYAFNITGDFDVYALAGVGLGIHHSNAYLYAKPEVGFIIREIFDMKTMLSVSRHINDFNEREKVDVINFTQAKYFNQNYAVFLHVNKYMSNNLAFDDIDFTFKKYF